MIENFAFSDQMMESNFFNLIEAAAPADKTREDLKKKGYLLEDTKEGVRVKKV